jgi:hypothetical protein
MRRFAKAILATLLLALASCSGNSDNAHTTATTIVSPPARQVLRVETRPSAKVPAKPAGSIGEDPQFNPQNPLLVFNLAKDAYRENEEVAIDFQLANATLKGDGGEYRVRYIVDDGEMRWIDKWEQVVLTGWTPGDHTIRLELVGPDGWPYRNGDYNVTTRQLTTTK